MLDPKKEKEFLSKLRTPIHKSYICEKILKTSPDVCDDILEKYISADIIEESKYSKGYYELKSQTIK